MTIWASIFIGLLVVDQPQQIKEQFKAKVTDVRDGDSILARRNGKEIHIRLEGIDCPEFKQAYGQQARQATMKLCLGKIVTVSSKGKDRYDRILGRVTLADGREINQELVKQGLAWWFKKYSKDKNLGKLEDSARAAKKGLWADTKPLAPWQWRAKNRKNEVTTGVLKIKPNGISIVALLPDPAGKDDGHEQVTLANSSQADVSLRGWRLIDKAGNQFRLDGLLKKKQTLVITIKQGSLPLDNNGDQIELRDPNDVARSRFTYKAEQVKRGNLIRAPKK